MSRYAELVFNLPVNRSFFYSIEGFTSVTPGIRVSAEFRRRKLIGYVVGVHETLPDELNGVEIKRISKVVDGRPVFNDTLLELARWLANFYLCSLGESLGAMIPGGKREREIAIDLPGREVRENFELADQQIKALERIASVNTGFFYLYGVTGSGKTEVYLRAARSALENRRGIIYLVPEISLTHQVAELFLGEFGDEVVVLHSGLSPSQRLKNWLKLLEGKAHIAIGARSTVFAPVRRLGLIIIDEEHEGAYKSSSTPRYHARQVAMYRSRLEHAVLVMGSATPSVEARYYMNRGVIEELRLPVRLSGGKMPLVEIVDMRREVSVLSNKLVKAIEEVKTEGKQTILFLNRRGFAYHFYCRSCGYEMKCKNCSVPMTYHKDKDLMICHYCGYREKPIEKCPNCGSLDVGYTGFGTERIEEEIKRIFPDFRVERLDTDSVRKKNVLATLLKNFKDGEIDILLGTQMVAKGLNFPGVKLVGIVLVDTDLQLPDFRSQEKTFQLVVQVAGRAGRVIPDGRVIIQTYRPDNEVIRLARDGKIEDFYERELELRRELRFPPFYRLLRLVFRGRDAERARKCAENASNLLGGFFKRLERERTHETGTKEDDVEILGPVEAPVFVIARNYRYQIIVRGREMKIIRRLVRSALKSLRCKNDVYVEIDVDPISLL